MEGIIAGLIVTVLGGLILKLLQVKGGIGYFIFLIICFFLGMTGLGKFIWYPIEAIFGEVFVGIVCLILVIVGIASFIQGAEEDDDI